LTEAFQYLAILPFPNIDPVAIQIGPLAIKWYGISYVVGILLGWLYARKIVTTPRLWANDKPVMTALDLDDFVFWAAIGIVVGGRLGYILFYDFPVIAANPLAAFEIWNGGMSFHGGMLGVIVAMAFFGWLRKRPFLQVTDLIAPCVPLGLASGRVGNFINGELWGRVADPSLPWAMIFPEAPDRQPRHPSQIYQFLGEGILLFLILWIFGKKERGRGQVSGLFLMGYGVLRFAAEFFREPDDFLGLLSLGMSMGQWLCVPMVVAGAIMFWWGSKQPRGQAVAAA
jgi:phosphatidylglycerol:prolipoprotein diacylglycerol transferase